MTAYNPGQVVARYHPMTDTQYVVEQVATRFEDRGGCQVFQWFVLNTETPDPATGNGTIVGQFYSHREAVEHVEKLVRC